MNRYVKEFLHRGMIFGGFGPIVAGVIYYVLEQMVAGFSLSGSEVFVAVVSTYVLAFLQAGSSIFHQIESWSPLRSLLCHFSVLYIAYVSCYLINTWIPFDPMVLFVFTVVFIAIYLAVCLIVVASIRLVSRKLNKKFK